MTIVAFTPSKTAPFQFEATLDGVVHNIIVTWNTYRQGYYINVYDTSMNLVVCKPMIGSPPNHSINLLFGYFTSTMSYFVAANQFLILS